MRLQAQTFERLVIGQIRETVGPRDGDDPIEHYLAVLADKTGSLIATAAEFGAHFAGADAAVIDGLRVFGEQIGVAFQLSDDILDIASESAESGKTPGTDLREGVATLPVLYALRVGTTPTPADRAGCASSSRARSSTTTSTPRRCALLRASSAPGRGADDAARLRRHAPATVLAGLPDVPARAALEALTDIVIARTG